MIIQGGLRVLKVFIGMFERGVYGSSLEKKNKYTPERNLWIWNQCKFKKECDHE